MKSASIITSTKNVISSLASEAKFIDIPVLPDLQCFLTTEQEKDLNFIKKMFALSDDMNDIDQAMQLLGLNIDILPLIKECILQLNKVSALTDDNFVIIMCHNENMKEVTSLMCEFARCNLSIENLSNKVLKDYLVKVRNKVLESFNANPELALPLSIELHEIRIKLLQISHDEIASDVVTARLGK